MIVNKQMKETRKLTVKGLVQGIGYRPFTAELAESIGITGTVRNTAGLVTIKATGTKAKLDRFTEELQMKGPVGASVDGLISEALPYEKFQGFTIEESETFLQAEIPQEFPPILPADLPTCPACLLQLKDRSDRRYRHPFISCTSCGPRYSIIEQLPYDRCNITMKDFAMCDDCAKEYQTGGNIRRHAQTIACHSCGPKLLIKQLQPAEGMADSALKTAITILRRGGILAVKDIGGFHLACLPTDEKAVGALRELKGRENKPFAMMFETVEQVKDYCSVNEIEESVLTSGPRPIVLLRKRMEAEHKAVESVSGSSPDIGAMLPCNPVQLMLLEACGPLIMTSANRSGEPMVIENEKMESWIAKDRGNPGDTEVPFGILYHERRILTPLDDSIFRVVSGRTQVLRRARGVVPNPIFLRQAADSPIFAAGGDLKSCFCYGCGDRAYLSQHLGDLEEEAVMRNYEQELTRMSSLFGFAPKEIAADLHPLYSSGKAAERLAARQSLPLRRIQHHHAHIASVMAEHHLTGQVLGVAFDGTGYGCDGQVWGSEFLLCKGKEMERMAHLKYVKLLGGDEGAKNTDSILYGYLHSFSETFDLGRLQRLPWIEEEKRKLIAAAISHNVNTVYSSSMGRLFDAVSALLGICHYNSYEGEAAIEMENSAGISVNPYPLVLTLKDGEDGMLGNTEQLFSEMIDALLSGIPKQDLAKGFLLAVSAFVETVCERLSVKQIALSGGTFQNRILLEDIIARLERKNYRVFINEKVPPGDGGICLGQMFLC